MVEKRDTQKRYNLPLEIKFCTKCVVSNQRPRISFDKEGCALLAVLQNINVLA